MRRVIGELAKQLVDLSGFLVVATGTRRFLVVC